MELTSYHMSKDYAYVEFAINDVTNRNEIYRIDDVHLPSDPTECYTGIFRFKIEFKEHVKKTGSVNGNSSFACYADHLWFDIDNEDDLEDALATLKALLKRLEDEYSVNLYQLEVYFSGKKGFHLGIPAELIGWEPDANLHHICKDMAIEIAGDIRIDKAIYDKNRLFRMPGSKHGESGLFKVRLNPVKTLESSTIPEIEQKAQVGDIYEPNVQVLELVPRLNELYLECKGVKKAASPAKSVCASSGRPCIVKLGEGVKQSERNDAGMRVASFLLEKSVPMADAKIKMQDWNLLNQPPMAKEEVDKIVDSAYSGGYRYSCNDVVLKQLCDQKCPFLNKPIQEKIVSKVFKDGRMLELVFDPNNGNSPKIAIRDAGGNASIDQSYTDPATANVFVPLENILIKKGNVKFPSNIAAFDSEQSLIEEIKKFISSYVCLPEDFLTISSYYVMLTHVYDQFTAIPYLRVIGDYNSGKSRFLKVIGSICYKSIQTNGGTSSAAIFRMADMFKGTILIDEGDFHKSDESAQIIKMLNIGYESGNLLMRCANGDSNFDVQAFDVFGPKIIATRDKFEDQALESRCLTQSMDGLFVAGAVPYQLPTSIDDEALLLRNKLLAYRFKMKNLVKPDTSFVDATIPPRVVQIGQVLMGLVIEPDAKKAIRAALEKQGKMLKEVKKDTIKGQVLQAILDIWNDPNPLTVKAVTEKVNDLLQSKQGREYQIKTIGSLIREFEISTKKTSKGIEIEKTELNEKRLKRLASDYGIETDPPK